MEIEAGMREGAGLALGLPLPTAAQVNTVARGVGAELGDLRLADVGLADVGTADVARSSGVVSVGVALEWVQSALNRVDPDRNAAVPKDRLAWAKLARGLADRMDALAGVLLGEAEQHHASMRATGTSTSSWLGVDAKLSKREVGRVLRQAKSLAEHSEVAAAASSGQIGAGQAQSIARVLDELAPQLDQSQQAHAQHLLVAMAGQLDSDQLARASAQVLAAVAPADTNELLERKLQREAEAAQRQRSLRFYRQDGSVKFDGSLPRVEGEQFVALIGAHIEALRRTVIEARDPLATVTTPEQRRADALMALLRSVGTGKRVRGAGQARVVVTLDYDKLRADAAAAGLIADGRQLSAGELRRLCCDAEIIPAVLGGESAVLDIGRASRQIPPAIRVALMLRDRGCAFPGCDVPADRCEGHHVIPWNRGGLTALSGLVLLCHHHHGLVEPAKFVIRDQWEVRLGFDGLPEFIPPRRLDPERRAIRHRRFPAYDSPPSPHGPPTAPAQPHLTTPTRVRASSSLAERSPETLMGTDLLTLTEPRPGTLAEPCAETLAELDEASPTEGPRPKPAISLASARTRPKRTPVQPRDAAPSDAAAPVGTRAGAN